MHSRRPQAYLSFLETHLQLFRLFLVAVVLQKGSVTVLGDGPFHVCSPAPIAVVVVIVHEVGHRPVCGGGRG